MSPQITQLHQLRRRDVLVPEPRAEHVQVARLRANWTRPRGPPGQVRSPDRPRPRPRRAARPPRRLEPEREGPAPPAAPPTGRGCPDGARRARDTSVRSCSYLAPLLRRPRNVRPAAPGAPASAAALPPSPGTRPSRLRSSEKPRAGTVMAANPRLPDGGSPPAAPVLAAAGRVPPPPARRESRSHPQPVPGHPAGAGAKLQTGLGAGPKDFPDRPGQRPAPGLQPDEVG